MHPRVRASWRKAKCSLFRAPWSRSGSSFRSAARCYVRRMASCAAGGTTILFGGKEIEGHRVCNDKCLAVKREELSILNSVSDEEARARADSIVGRNIFAMFGDDKIGPPSDLLLFEARMQILR